MSIRTVILVGGDSLAGREVREAFAERKLGDLDLQLASTETTDSVSARLPVAEEDDAEIATPLNEADLREAALLILAGEAAAAKRAWEMYRQSGSSARVIDLTYALEDLPQARLRAPGVEAVKAPDWSVALAAHPAAIVLAALAERLREAGPVRAIVAQVMEPASERGMAGIQELEQQVRGLLGFRELPKKLFDAQLAFNLLPRYGQEAPLRLEDIEQRLERHLATLLGGRSPMPSVRLVQAPVFHGYSVSVWVEFEERVATDELAETLESEWIEVRGSELDAPTSAGVAGQRGITVGVLTRDNSRPQAVWLWAVTDNLRLSAEMALDLVEEGLN